MRHVGGWLAWWVALFWLWLLLVGQWNGEELVAAAIAAAISAGIAELARSRTRFGVSFPVAVLADLPSVLAMVFVDFGILVWALVASVARRRIVRGEFVAREVEHSSRIARGAGPRAWTVLLASYSPNAYVVDVDPKTRRVLLHDLIPHRPSEDPA
ncbi:MAG TPA: hypothetical protein VJ716_04265 [Gaiellaceae bacterium]|nr:hypothetical protein [Gaiellaceae bacterium]